MHRHLVAVIAAFFGISTAATAQPSTAPASSAPAAWVRYAQAMQQQFQTVLTGDSISAQRLRTYLASASDRKQKVAVSVWVSSLGTTSRVAFEPYLDSQANTDLTTLLTNVKLADAPPSDMLQPVHLVLQIAPDSGKAAAPGEVPAGINPSGN